MEKTVRFFLNKNYVYKLVSNTDRKKQNKVYIVFI